LRVGDVVIGGKDQVSEAPGAAASNSTGAAIKALMQTGSGKGGRSHKRRWVAATYVASFRSATPRHGHCPAVRSHRRPTVPVASGLIVRHLAAAFSGQRARRRRVRSHARQALGLRRRRRHSWFTTRMGNRVATKGISAKEWACTQSPPPPLPAVARRNVEEHLDLPSTQKLRVEKPRPKAVSVFVLFFFVCVYFGFSELEFENRMLSDGRETVPAIAGPRPACPSALLILIAVFMHAAFRSFDKATRTRRRTPMLRLARRVRGRRYSGVRRRRQARTALRPSALAAISRWWAQ